MFAGIVEKKSRVTSVRADGVGKEMRIQNPAQWKHAIGDSVSVQGICSTVVSSNSKEFTVVYMKESLMATTCSSFQKGTEVNLERSLVFGDRVHGHLVQGHISSIGIVERVTKKKNAWNISLRIDARERKFIVRKGSIAVDGVSLTIAQKTVTGCVVSLIPHTAHATTLGSLEKGARVNIETDFLLRAYLSKA